MNFDKEEIRPMILTAKIEEDAQKFFNQMRKRCFPTERNCLDAHLTLFHKLPYSEINKIYEDISEQIRNQEIMNATANGIMFMGYGSAYQIVCERLIKLHHHLQSNWSEWLSNQDKQKLRPHVTFQNKVKAVEAKATYEYEAERFEPFDFKIIGLELWFYDGGPWEYISSFSFD